MAKLVSVVRSKEYVFACREMPLEVEDDLTVGINQSLCPVLSESDSESVAHSLQSVTECDCE